MSINIEIEYIKRIERENEELKKEIDKQKNYNMSHAQRISELKKKNNKVNEINVDLYKKVKKQDDEILKLSDELTLKKKKKKRHNHIQTLEINELKNELKEASSDVGIFIEENKQLKDRISNLVHTNTNLQNDLFSEQLLQDETEEYINRLKQELFNLYLKQYN